MLVNKEILFGKYLSGNASAEDIKKLTSWLHENPANQEEFDHAEKVWKASLNLKNEKDADVEKAWNEFKSLRETQTEIKITQKNSNWLKIAAAISLFVVLGIVVKMFFTEPSTVTSPTLANIEQPSANPDPEVVPELEPVIVDTMQILEPSSTAKKTTTKKRGIPLNNSNGMVTVSAGDSAEIFLLPDNSIVYLNAHSKLEYAPSFSSRNVFLTGEAYFDVKRDSGQFAVTCENTIIRGKDGLFNVKGYSKDKEVEVIVASGVVEFSGIGYKDFKKLVLKNGESGVYNKQKSAITKLKHQRSDYKWWQKKSLRAKIKAFFDRLMGKK